MPNAMDECSPLSQTGNHNTIKRMVLSSSFAHASHLPLLVISPSFLVGQANTARDYSGSFSFMHASLSFSATHLQRWKENKKEDMIKGNLRAIFKAPSKRHHFGLMKIQQNNVFLGPSNWRHFWRWLHRNGVVLVRLVGLGSYSSWTYFEALFFLFLFVSSWILLNFVLFFFLFF